MRYKYEKVRSTSVRECSEPAPPLRRGAIPPMPRIVALDEGVRRFRCVAEACDVGASGNQYIRAFNRRHRQCGCFLLMLLGLVFVEYLPVWW
jgi:hypothetical protein